MKDGRVRRHDRIRRAIPAAQAVTVWLKDVLIAAMALLALVVAYHILVAMPKAERLISDSDEAVRNVNDAAKSTKQAAEYARDTLKNIKDASQQQSKYWASLSQQAHANLLSLQKATDNLAELESNANVQLNDNLLPKVSKSVSDQNENLTATLGKVNDSLDGLRKSESLAVLSLQSIANITGDKAIPEAIHHVDHSLDRVDIWVTRSTKRPNVIFHGLIMALKVLVAVAQIHSGL